MVSSGTGYMGSTNKAITALKATFQTPLYPLLDQVRSALGAKIDLELAHLKVINAIFCQKRKEKATPSGVNLMRSKVLYRAAQVVFCHVLVTLCDVMPHTHVAFIPQRCRYA